jgi:hypothetical protein
MSLDFSELSGLTRKTMLRCTIIEPSLLEL